MNLSMFLKYVDAFSGTMENKQLVSFIHEAIDKQIFDKGNEIAEILIGLKIMIGGECQDYASEPLELEDLERYWQEVFRSDSRVVNYMRMIMECCDFSVWKEELQKINHSHLKQSKSMSYYECTNSTDLKLNTEW